MSDSDCKPDNTSGLISPQVCTIDMEVTTKSCSCKDGIDVCVRTGACEKFCDSQTDAITAHNTKVGPAVCARFVMSALAACCKGVGCDMAMRRSLLL